MEEISAFRQQLESLRPADWEMLPDFPLYMDQVLSYMERQTIRLDESDALTGVHGEQLHKKRSGPQGRGKEIQPGASGLSHVYLYSQAGDVRPGTWTC